MQVSIENGELHVYRINSPNDGSPGGQPLGACFQCHKCTSGCPVAEIADFTPAQVVRLWQYGMEELLLQSQIIWLCAGCETCGARCPNGINVGRLIDGLREMALAKSSPGTPERLFHNQFLASVRTYGRVHETGLMVRYKLASGQLFTDLKLGLELFKRGKLNLVPPRVKKKDQVRQIFDQVRSN